MQQASCGHSRCLQLNFDRRQPWKWLLFFLVLHRPSTGTCVDLHLLHHTFTFSFLSVWKTDCHSPHPNSTLELELEHRFPLLARGSVPSDLYVFKSNAYTVVKYDSFFFILQSISHMYLQNLTLIHHSLLHALGDTYYHARACFDGILLGLHSGSPG